jgi:hypothetical protein
MTAAEGKTNPKLLAQLKNQMNPEEYQRLDGALNATVPRTGGNPPKTEQPQGAKPKPQPQATPSQIIENVRVRVNASDGKFRLNYSDAELKGIINRGRGLGLDDGMIEDFIFVGARDKKPLTASELMTQMNNYVNVVSRRGYPYRFQDAASYRRFEQDVRTRVQGINLPNTDVRLQGSALRNPNARDLDVAIMVDPKTFRRLSIQRFIGRVKENGKVINIESMSDQELLNLARRIDKDRIDKSGIFNSQAKGFMYNILSGKINREDVPGLKQLERYLIDTYGETDVSVMIGRGELDMNPYWRLK